MGTKDDSLEKKYTKLFKGKKISLARYMTREEAEEFGWTKIPLVLFFSDNSLIVFQTDEEGNNGGSAYYQKGDSYQIIPTI